MRLLIIGKSQLSGKTNTVGNLLLRPFDETDSTGMEFYRNNFEGDDIFIVCPSTMTDAKWKAILKGKRIPDGNVYPRYDEQELEALYDKLEKKYHAAIADGKKPTNKLVIFDDCSFSGALKDKLHGIMSKFACNSRHFLISIIVTAQKYTDISTTLRENATGMMLYACSMKQQELLYNDIGEGSKKDFLEMFRACTHEKHSFLVVNYSNDPDMRFMDSHFEPI